MSDKEMVLEAVGRLPETATLDQIRDELELIAGIQRGLEDSKAGRVKTTEEVKKLVESWCTK
ncbi:MAG: hypothetical protein ABQ298_12045 [Puniceicoccaceae bacterium]